MSSKTGNIFELPEQLPSEELFEALLEHEKILIEKVVSSGQVTPPGDWYDQDQDEWLIVLQGRGRTEL